jgi:hypothetical protein
MYHQPIPQQSHHGNGQWTGDGYGYGGPPLPSNGYPIAQHATYNKNGPPRPPLGPPPSARRGPSSYYSQQMADVHPIVEEAERASLTKEMMEGEGAWGSQSGVSMTSIPIGIPKFYLDGRESGISLAASSHYSDYAPDVSPPTREEPLKTFRQRMQQQDADDCQENMSTQQQKAAERQEARGMNNDYFPPPDAPAGSSERGESPSEAPVRQASMGRRRRPTLTTVKSGDRLRSSSTASNDASTVLSNQQKEAEEADTPVPRRRLGGDAKSGAGRPIEQSLTAPPPPVQPADMPSSDAKALDPSSESTNNVAANATQDSPKSSVRAVNSKETLSTPKPTLGHKSRGRSPLAKTDNNDDHDPLDKEILVEDPEKGGKFGLLRQDSDTLMSPTTGLSAARAGKRKPPMLDVEKIKEEEKRGSLSSLSDLIKRATKVASNLDRGRTASRLGMEAWLGPGNGKGMGNSNNNSSGESEKYRRSAGSLSDILASFPPPAPGVLTPTGGRENRNLANWSSRRSSAPLPSDSDGASQIRSRKQRRCCGLPLWLFIVLLLLLIALVAAAAVIPVFLVVIPNQKHDSTPSAQSDLAPTQAATSNKCAAKVTCENGGQAFPTGEDTCRCLCVNSFTGPTCSSRSTAGCSSIAVPGLQDNATIGDAIPRLITKSETDYDLKLDAQTLLGLFNEVDLNCAAENALVTFNGKAQKLRRTPAPQASQTNANQPAEATSNGIVFDSSPSPSQTSVSTTPSSTSSSSSASPTASKTIDVDFARAAVLYILQSSSSLQDAETAQKALQENVSDGLGGVVDVGEWNVDFDAKVVTKA